MNKQKKILLLGGIRYLLPVIEAAHKHGYYVITADYIPDNIAHKYSDEYVNVSIIDKEAVLKVAQEKQIDGIMSFGVDPGVVTAAYVAEKMELPNVGPYESVEILQNKDKFRAFLAEHNFNVPKAQGFDNMEEALKCQWVKDSLSYEGKAGIGSPLIVKPTDSAGSKGVTRVDSLVEYESALKHAFECSHSHHVIVEQFIEKEGCSSDSDMFSIDGQLKVVTYSSQYFDETAANPYTPAAFCWPSTYTKQQEKYLTSEIQRLLTLLHMRTSIYNVETRVGKDGTPYIMEVSPRGGGNNLAEMWRKISGVNMIDAIVQYAVGDIPEPNVLVSTRNSYMAEIVLHAPKSGHFVGVDVPEELARSIDVFFLDLWISRGDKVTAFKGANDTIGMIERRFDNKKDMIDAVTHQREWLKVVVK